MSKNDTKASPEVAPINRQQAAEALQVLAKVGADFRGTLRDHEMIQTAVQILDKIIAGLPAAPLAPVEDKQPAK